MHTGAHTGESSHCGWMRLVCQRFVFWKLGPQCGGAEWWWTSKIEALWRGVGSSEARALEGIHVLFPGPGKFSKKGLL